MVPHKAPVMIFYLNSEIMKVLAEKNARKMRLHMAWFNFFEVQYVICLVAWLEINKNDKNGPL